MRYVPSPIPLKFEVLYSATSNKSGRMQYHKIVPGQSKIRISRTEFIHAFNSSPIVALNPLQINGSEADFQIEFYV